MEFSQMASFQVTRLLEPLMTASPPSSRRLDLANTSPEPSSLIWNPPSLMRSGLEPTGSCSTPSRWSVARRMPPTTTPEVTTPLARRSLILSLTESGSWQITALVFKDSSSSTLSEAELDLASLPVDGASVRGLWEEVQAGVCHLSRSSGRHRSGRALQLH